MREEFPDLNREGEFENILSYLREVFPKIAVETILDYQDVEEDLNARFAQDPDDVLAHEPKWHQWGIITHTKFFENANDIEVPEYLREWGFLDAITKKLSEEIDGLAKKSLLKIAVLFHDLGKFAGRKIRKEKAGFSFQGHESMSGQLVRGLEISGLLKQRGFTHNQIEYIAKCAELHYKLGALRDRAKEQGGYTMAFVASHAFDYLAKELMSADMIHAAEIGILFLGDSLAKTDLRIEAANDEDIERNRKTVENRLKSRGLPSGLINAILQLPVNIAAAKNYLRIWHSSISQG